MRNENKGGGIFPSLRELAEIDWNTSGENAISSMHQSTIRQFLFKSTKRFLFKFNVKNSDMAVWLIKPGQNVLLYFLNNWIKIESGFTRNTDP
jgi:hypothetical protein